MNSRTLAQQRVDFVGLPRRATRGTSFGVAAHIPSADVLLVFAAAILALSVFELAAWLASAPLATLVVSVALVPLALFLTAVLSGRQRD